MIKEFQKDYRWLSNFAPVAIVLDGVTYPSIEHAYMSAKSDNADWKKFCANEANTPGHVKRASKNIDLVADWATKKLVVMEDCVNQKFSKSPYKLLLLKTGTVHIQEGNRWGDKFWGVCLKTGKGSNNLGKLIMSARAALKQQ